MSNTRTPPYNYLKLETAPGKYHLFKRIPNDFPRPLITLIAEYADPYADMTPDYKAAEDQAALTAAMKVKADIPQDAIRAARHGHLWSLDYLFASKFVDPNQVLLTGENRPFAVKHTTLLAEAIANGQPGVATKLLVEYKVTPQNINQCVFEISQLNTTTYLGNALSFAIQKGDVELVKKLLEKGADPARCIDTDKENITSPDKNCDPYVSAVTYAETCSQLAELEKTKPGIRKEIIQALQPVLSSDSRAEAESSEAKKEEEGEGDDLDDDFHDDLYKSLTPNFNEHNDKTRVLKLEDKIQNCALRAARKGYLLTLKYLFKEKLADPNKVFNDCDYRYYRGQGTYTTLLIEAINKKQIGVAVMLLEECSLTAKNIKHAHSNLSSDGHYYFGNALRYAISAGEVDLVIRLLNHGANPDKCIRKDNERNRNRVFVVSAEKYIEKCQDLKKLEETKPGIRQQILDAIAAHRQRPGLKR